MAFRVSFGQGRAGKRLRQRPSALGERMLQGGRADAVAEIAKALAVGASGGEEREERVEHFGDPVQRHLVGERLVEPGALEIAADKERVEARHAADDADIAGIGPGAAVRAAGDADAEPFVLEPVALAAAPRSRRRCRRGPARPRSAPARSSAGPGRRAPSARPAACRRRGARRARAARPRSRRGRRGDLAQDDVLARHQDRVAAEPATISRSAVRSRVLVVDDAPARHRMPR